MIDPKTRLAFSFANAPGTMAVLLGAGVSRSAGILSGWEVLVSEIQRVATASREPVPEPDAAEAWYQAHTGQAPTYSNVLHSIAPTPAQRHAVLARYFEPNEEAPREPTATHHAVARLVAAGLVRIIVTTNFDRLMEQALEAAGVIPRVVASPAQIAGMTPLAHARCTVIKVHGDYLHGDLRNSDAEIGTYPPEVDKLLDRVFDEYGLFVVGWSGTWDHALRAAIERAPARRYPQTWLAVGGTSAVADGLIAHRGMVLIAADAADLFVPGVADTAVALHAAQTPTPDTEFALVERQKRYLRAGAAGDMDHLLMLGEVRDRLREAILTLPTAFTSGNTDGQWEEYRQHAEALEQHSAAACALALRGLRFGTPEVQAFWIHAIGQLASIERLSGNGALLELRRYPAVLVAYAYVVGAFLRKNGEAIRDLWAHRLDRGREKEDRLLDAACVRIVPRDHLQVAFKQTNGDKWKAPGSRRALSLLTPRVEPLVGGVTGVERAFGRIEYLWALALAVRTWAPDNSGGVDGFVGHHLFVDGSGPEFGGQIAAGERPWDWILPSGCLQTNSRATLDQVLPAFTQENSKHSRW